MKKILRIILYCSLGSITLDLAAKKVQPPMLRFPAPEVGIVGNKPFSLNLDAAVSTALKHRPDLEAYSYATQANKAVAKAAIAGYYPKFSLQSTFNQQTGEKDINNTTYLNADQLIYSFAGPLQQYKKAKKVSEISKLDEDVLANKIKLETTKAFLQAWLLQKQQQTIRALKKSSTETFKLAQHQNKLDLLDKNVWLKNVEDFAANESTISQYSDSVQIAYRRLEFLLGQPLLPQKHGEHPTQLEWRYTKNPHIDALEAYYNYALKNRPEIKQSTQKIGIEKDNITLAQGARLPTVSANFQSGHLAYHYDATNLTPSYGYYSASVSIAWPFFDGLVSQYQEQQAYASKIKETLLKDQAILDIKQEVQEKYHIASQALTNRKAQKIKYLRTRNDFKLSKLQFKIGQIAEPDFETAKTAWQQAQLDWLTVNANTENSLQDLIYACGYPDELA